eukprot:TRINITY_DN1327_c0_g3_i2.p1 TRINITY_DN1327_c0_g3~~TRINITY_DN1327_c0_g3_i2.p1  ORF type:complete len:599 (-),score=247.94 TRINITY_DN1327_c0_g3_i2:206-2002(-)
MASGSFFPQILYDGVGKTMNCQFSEGRKTFEVDGKVDPRFALELANVTVNASWITQAENDRLAALDALQAADKLAKAVLHDDAKLSEHIKRMTGSDSTDPEVRWNWSMDVRLVYAEALMGRSLMQLQLGNYIKGAYNLRKAFKAFEHIQKDITASGHKLHPELDDILKSNLGVFYFFASFAPGMFLKVLELLGFVADRDLGMEYLEGAYQRAGIRFALSGVFLCLNYIFIPRGLSKIEDNLKAAHVIIDSCLERLPGNATFRMMAGQLALKEGDIPVAIQRHLDAIDAVKELPDVPFPYYMGASVCHFVNSDWAAAAKLLHKITDTPAAKKFDMKGLAGLQLATCYYMLGDQKMFKETVDKIPSMISKNSRFDKLAAKKLGQYKKRGFGLAPFEMMYVRRDLHHVHADLAQPLLDKLEENYKKIKENPEDKAPYLLIRGVLLKCLGKPEESKAGFRTILELEKSIKEETWVVPNACQELGEMLYWEGDLDAAEELYKKASKYSGFDWEDVVKNRIKLSLETIKKQKKQEKKQRKAAAKSGSAVSTGSEAKESDDENDEAPHGANVVVPDAVLKDGDDDQEPDEPEAKPTVDENARDLD